MLIEGPMKISVAEPANDQGRILVIAFTPEFQAMSVEEQGADFNAFQQHLADGIASLEEDDPNRQGMLIVQQIAGQLAPRIASGDLPVEETLTIQIDQNQEQQYVGLVDLLQLSKA
ncbi:MAG: transcriptional regulator [Sedimenticola sp.]